MTDPGQNKTRRGGGWLGVATVAGAVATVALAAMVTAPNTGRDAWPASFSGPGEQLYFTGRDATGGRMMPRGGNHHRAMMGNGGCADCHGVDRNGGRLWPTFWQVAPALTGSALTGDHGHDGHEHDSYDAETLARAITDGIRPDGSRIGAGMPLWSMSPASLDDLVRYLLRSDHEH